MKGLSSVWRLVNAQQMEGILPAYHHYYTLIFMFFNKQSFSLEKKSTKE